MQTRFAVALTLALAATVAPANAKGVRSSGFRAPATRSVGSWSPSNPGLSIASDSLRIAGDYNRRSSYCNWEWYANWHERGCRQEGFKSGRDTFLLIALFAFAVAGIAGLWRKLSN